MCNHEYIGKYAVGTSEKCSWPEIFERWDTTPPSTVSTALDRSLAIDKQGFCLFHSTDKAFKLKNNFAEWLTLLFHFANEDTDLKDIDCREFLILGELATYEQFESQAQVKIGQYFGGVYQFQLKDFEAKKSIDLRHSLVADKLQFSTCTFQGSIDFTATVFETSLEIEECLFKSSFNLDRVSARELYVLNVAFDDPFYANRIKVWDSFTLTGCHFVQCFMMLHAEVDGEIATLEYCHFDEVTSFDDSVFDCMASFNQSVFQAETSLQRVAFRDMVYFNDISIANSFIVSGKSKAERCFDSQVEFQPKEVSGFIKLENANFFHFNKVSRQVFEDLKIGKKVELGPGCVDYTCIVTFDVHLTKNIHYFSEEIAHNFAFYFQLLHGIHLGINVNRISDQLLRLAYFTDEPIDDDEFRNKIEIAQEQLAQLACRQRPEDAELTLGNDRPALYDAWLKTKFNFIRAGIATNTREVEDVAGFITEVFKPMNTSGRTDNSFFLERTITETKKHFPQINLHISMDRYKIENNAFHGPMQIGSGNTQHNQSALGLQEAINALNKHVIQLYKSSDQHTAVLTEILKELDTQAENEGHVKKETFEKLKSYLEAGASAAEITGLLLTLEQFAS